MWWVCISILWASCTKHFRLVGWYLRGVCQGHLGLPGRGAVFVHCPLLEARLESLQSCTTLSKTFHVPVLNHVISPGAKTFAIVGWPRRQQYLLVDSRQEAVQCPCRVWILYKGKSSHRVLPKFQKVLMAQSSPQPPPKWDLYVKLCKPFLSWGLDL